LYFLYQNDFQLLTDPKKLENLFDAIDKIEELVDASKSTVLDVDSVIIENRSDIRNTILIANESSLELKRMINSMQSSVENINTILEQNDIEKILKNTSEITETIKRSKLNELIEQITEVASQTNLLLTKIDDDIDQGSQDFSESLRLLKLSLRNLNEATRKINSDPSVLIRGNKTSNDNPDERLDE
jgi:phospholipid/cholesterol/gamma-HCH transport system substrate-binding protein